MTLIVQFLNELNTKGNYEEFKMLSGPQKVYIQESFTEFASSLTRDQLRQLRFRLDDLMRYNSNSLSIAYYTITKFLRLSKEKRTKLKDEN